MEFLPQVVVDATKIFSYEEIAEWLADALTEYWKTRNPAPLAFPCAMLTAKNLSDKQEERKPDYNAEMHRIEKKIPVHFTAN